MCDMHFVKGVSVSGEGRLSIVLRLPSHFEDVNLMP